LLPLWIFASFPAYTQQNISHLFERNEHKGDYLFLDLYYEEAIKYYQMALKKNSNNDLVKLKLAESYRRISDFPSAAKWFGDVLENNPENASSMHKYHYAQSLLSTENYEEAKKWFAIYQGEVAEDSRPQKKIFGIDRRDLFFRDSVIIDLDTLPINSSGDDFGATWYKNGLVFISARGHNSLVDHDLLREETLLDLYYVAYDSLNQWGEVRIFDKNLRTPFHEGPLTFFSNEKQLIFTRSNVFKKKPTRSADGQTKLQLFTATKSSDTWGNIHPFSLNNNGYSIAHPTLTSGNDTLYFSSDMEGGFGGRDLYISVNQEGQWASPVNLGPIINTEGDEMFPYFIDDRLFFSSDGHEGLGGLDNYKAFIRNGSVTGVINLGYPLNSHFDDFAFSIFSGSMMGYFSSNRIGGMGKDDIYAFNQKAHLLNGLVQETQNQSSLSDVKINLLQNGNITATTFSNDQGQFYFYLPFSSDFQLEAFKDGHTLYYKHQISSHGLAIDLDTVLLKLRKHDLFAQGIIYDNETQQRMHDVKVILQDKSEVTVDTLITASNGYYSFVLRPKREYHLRIEKDHFLPQDMDINTISISKGTILNDFVLEEEYLDKEVIFFDFDKSNLSNDVTSTLQRVVKILYRYPQTSLIIGAHADARGTKEYNQNLSEARAQSTLKFFRSQGINQSRIIARGFGEELIINRCTNGINCHEEDHSKNRRAEIKIEIELPKEEFE